jgi:truncated hemoglobin YjbI
MDMWTQVALPNPRFEVSYERIFGADVAMGQQSEAFFTAFYARFLLDPEVAARFAGLNMRRQVEMMRRSLFQLASFYVLGEPSSAMSRLSEVHQRLDLAPGLFDVWLQALLDTVQEFDDQCDEATRLAWAWAMTPGITFIRLSLVQ